MSLVTVMEIRCPTHGNVTIEVVTETLLGSGYDYLDWTGRATTEMVRAGAVHLNCGERLLWTTEPA